MIAALLALFAGVPSAAYLDVPLTALVAADVARCESSARFDDGAAVLATAMTRARRWKRPLLSILRQPRQFARGCPAWPRTWSARHLRMGLDAALGRLQAPGWAWGAVEYLGPSDDPALIRTRGPMVGRLVHTFHGPRP